MPGTFLLCASPLGSPRECSAHALYRCLDVSHDQRRIQPQHAVARTKKVVPIRLPCCEQRDEDGTSSPGSTAATTAITVARIVKPSA